MARASGENSEKAEKHKKQMIIISFLSVLNILLFLIEIYEILNDQNNLPIIGALGVFILATVYVETVFIRRIGISRIKEQEEAYHNIYRSEKASYLLLRKNFEQMEQKLERIEKQSAIPYEELIASQKALTKVQINRGKENTSVLMTANNQIIDKLNTIQRTIENSNAVPSDIMNEGQAYFAEESKEILIGQQELTDGNKNILEKQEDILKHIKEMEESLKDEIQISANTINSLKKQIEESQFSNSKILNNEQSLEPLNFENMSLDQDSSLISNTEMNQKESSLNQEESTEMQINKNSLETDLDQLLEEMNNPVGTLEPIVDNLELEPMIDDSELESIIGDSELKPIVEEQVIEPVTEEPALDSILAEPEIGPIFEEPELEPVIEDTKLKPIIEKPELEPTIDDLELEPLMNDSNLDPVSDKAESIPEEPLKIEEPEVQTGGELDLDPGIQQMINELEQEPEVRQMADKSESEIQPLVIDSGIQPIHEEELDSDNIQLGDLEMDNDSGHVMSADEIAALLANTDSLEEPKPVEDKPDMPDLSDPGHVMSADEIAALIANL